MKLCYVFLGNYGSGKTELALNFAINAAKSGPSALVDLDIVNPYFRSAERKTELLEAGVRLIHPVFANAMVDVPALPPDIYSVFTDKYDTVIFDAGGDPAGAAALGQYKAYFEALESGVLETLLVVNPFRPLSGSAAQVEELLEKIRLRSRLAVTGLVNNANLGNETTPAELFLGLAMLAAVSDDTHIPVRYTTATKENLSAYLIEAEKQGIPKQYIGRPVEIARYTHRDWERFTRAGV